MEETDMPDAEAASPVTLTPRDVQNLRGLLARTGDRSATPEERADARVELCGYVAAALDRPQDD